MTHLSALALTRPGDTRDHDRGQDWRTRGECVGMDPSIFEPDDDHTPSEAEWAFPRRICNGCPVKDLCLEDAIAVEPRAGRFGMRGAATPDERQAIYRHRGRIAMRLGGAA